MCLRDPFFWGGFLLLCLGSTLREWQVLSAFPPLPMGHLPHVEQYEVVQPLQLPISGNLNELSSSPTLYPETIRYLLGLSGNNFTLHLRRNRHLVGSDYTETYTSPNGTEVTEKPQVGQHCFYQGHVEGYRNSVASISTCLGIRGFFKAGSTIHLIEPLDQQKHGIHREKDDGIQARHGSLHKRQDSTDKKHDGTDTNQEKRGSAHERYGIIKGRQSGTHEKHGSDEKQHESIQERPGIVEEKHGGDQEKHAIYRQQDFRLQHRTCGVSKVTLTGELETMMDAVSIPRNWLPGSIPKDTHYVELFVVVDNEEYKKYRNLQILRQRVREIVNHVDSLYQEINFRVVLIGLEIWDKENKASIDSDIESTLSNFLKWRDSNLSKKKPHDNAQLITGVSFKGTIGGLARLASMCTESSGGVSHDYSINPFGVATTLAHEIGHNLGMDHDENIWGCQCEKSEKDDRCIMTSTSSVVFPKKFSSCSKYNLQKFLMGNIFSSSCLNNLPALEEPEEGPLCGNKLLEQGEECDCGPPEECLNQCCNAKNCQLAPGAECAEGGCCQGCRVTPNGEICREAQNTCDLAEYCDGKQPECPENVYKQNGTPCRNGYCYNGVCPTYEQQCQALWGSGAGVSTDKCYLLNLPKGCTKAFYPSRMGLEKCKFLSCSRPTTIRSARHLCSFLLDDERCDLAVTNSENHSPFQLVAPGTKCGREKVCQNRSCQDLSVYGTRNCSKKCHRRGVCNHKRECHCDPGWAPPDCKKKLIEESLGKEKVSFPNLPLPIQVRLQSLKNKRLLVGVLMGLTLMAMLAILVFILYKWKMGKKKEITESPSTESYVGETVGYP